MYSRCSLPTQDRAEFATSSRLLSRFVSESHLKALYLPISSSPSYLTGLALVLSPSAKNGSNPYPAAEIVSVIPLRHIPIFELPCKMEISQLHPLDMLPYVYEVQGNKPVGNNCEISSTTLSSLVQAGYVAEDSSLTLIPKALQLWQKFAEILNLNKDVRETMAAELASSVSWQQYYYENPLPAPTFDSPSIAWEQSIIEGQATHPMHKARQTFPPVGPIQPGGYDWYNPKLRIVSVPRASMTIRGPWDDLFAPVCVAVVKQSGKEFQMPEDHVLVPVHELQAVHIQQKFSEAHVLPPEFSVNAVAQSSIRSMLLPTILREHSIKLPLDVLVTSHVRTNKPSSTHFGQCFSMTVVPHLKYDRSLLIVQRELATIAHIEPNEEVSQHFTGIIREAYENISLEKHGERVIVCAALPEVDGNGVDETPLVQTAFGLDTEEKRLAWFDKFVDMFLRAFLPPMLVNGVSFQAHMQNVLARFDANTHELKGFVIRDFAIPFIHSPTFLSSTGACLDDEILHRRYVSLDTVYSQFYNTVIRSQFQRLSRVLDLHHSGKGWAAVRKHLRAQIPADHPIVKLWLSHERKTLPGYCLLSWRLIGYHSSNEVPNLIHFKGDNGLNSVQNEGDSETDK